MYVCLSVCRSTRAHFVARASFQRSTVNEWGISDVSTITAYFHSQSFVVSQENPINIADIVQYFNDRVDGFICNGSGYVLAWIDSLTASFVRFRPLGAASFAVDADVRRPVTHLRQSERGSKVVRQEECPSRTVPPRSQQLVHNRVQVSSVQI